MPEIRWNVNGIFKANAEKVYSEINSIGEKYTPADVLEKARSNKESELHKCFEWNDSIAGEKYRLIQARKVIQMLYVVPEKKSDPSVRVIMKTSELNTYQPTYKFITQTDEYADLLRRAKEELNMFERKYHTIVELEQVFESIHTLVNN